LALVDIVQSPFWWDNLYLEGINIAKWRHEHGYTKTPLWTGDYTGHFIFYSKTIGNISPFFDSWLTHSICPSDWRYQAINKAILIPSIQYSFLIK